MNTVTVAEQGRAARPSRRRTLLLIAGLAAVIVLAFVGYMAWRMSYIPADLDYSTTRLSDAGVFRATYAPRTPPIRINAIHSWTLHVETAGGQPVTGAQITVDGGMPQHGHGLPTQPRVTKDLGGGDYLVEGMKFQMPGWWVVKFAVKSGDQADTTTFNLMLQ